MFGAICVGAAEVVASVAGAGAGAGDAEPPPLARLAAPLEEDRPRPLILEMLLS